MGICVFLITVGFAAPLGALANKSQDPQEVGATATSQHVPEGLAATIRFARLFLPVAHRDQIPVAGQGVPIWSHYNQPAAHEVNLFRHGFTLSENLGDASLQILADTRYEVWIDGAWIGRGPARFSIFTREYDVYNVGTLEEGNHLIAVLVQWAPNNRRSESTTPYLIAHLEGKNSGGKSILAGTGTHWRTLNSDAWKANTAPVHAWGLIGPTELLDYRRLPANWMDLDFNDRGWPVAVVKDLSVVDFHPLVVPRLTGYVAGGPDPPFFEALDIQEIDPNSISFRPRSLPLLVDVPVEAAVLDTGHLSPDRRIGELQPGIPTQEFHFSSGDRISLKVEVLSTTGLPVTGDSFIDGSPFQWNAPSPARPDVYIAEASIGRGDHTLRFTNTPPDGLTFALSDQEIKYSNFPFQQGLHAGRRLLLAEPVSDLASAQVSASGDRSLDVNLSNLPAYVVLDLGRTIHGRLAAEVSGPPGTIIDIGWDERLLPDTLRPLPYPGSLHPQWNQVDSWILDGAPRELRTIDARAGRYLLIAAWGVGPVQFSKLRVFEERLPLEQVGDFSSQDAVLDAVWQIGADTLYSNMSDAYADPWRERGQWWGDAYVSDHTNRAAFGDTSLLRRGIYFMAEAVSSGKPNAMAPNGSGLHMLDYGMLWVQSSADYFERTGDHTILDQIFPRVSEFMTYLATYESPTTGLLDIPDGSWTQTTYIDTVGQASRYGQSTAVNALYYGTLIDASSLAEQAGYSKEATRWNNKAGAVKRAVNTSLFRPAEHRYVTSLRDGKTVAPSAHAQAWALAYDLVPAVEVTPVANSLLNLISMQPQSPEVEIYGTFWVLEALGKAGMVEAGIDLIKVYYGHMLDSGATTTWEIYNSDQYFTQSLSHGWGSAPTWFLTTYLLGARQTGLSSWEVMPAFEGADQASGVLPLPQGVLQVSWVTHSLEDSVVQIDSPSGTLGRVVLANTPGMVISLDGIPYRSKDSMLTGNVIVTPECISVPLTGGIHTITVTRPSGIADRSCPTKD